MTTNAFRFSTTLLAVALFTWSVLAIWVLYEARMKGIRHGWIALALGVVPGVATGFGVYLLLRLNQEA